MAQYIRGTIEDTSPQFIGCYENEKASTPVIDQLAREGVKFTNAFSTGVVCSPSRSAIITGVRLKFYFRGHVTGFQLSRRNHWVYLHYATVEQGQKIE